MASKIRVDASDWYEWTDIGCTATSVYLRPINVEIPVAFRVKYCLWDGYWMQKYRLFFLGRCESALQGLLSRRNLRCNR